MDSWLSGEKKFMELAFSYAQQALQNLEVPVGCIFVYHNEVLVVGRNEVNQSRNATRHAEMVCIDHVHNYCKANRLDSGVIFSQVVVYVTVEPCIMCAAALYSLNVKSVTFGCKNDRFGGSTVFNVAERLKTETIIKGGYQAAKSMDLLKKFYKGTNPNAPPSKSTKKV
ncbi:tRNA-specific adenosine deaminase 2-like isoform X4 [Cylas formicarius]|uniref:tRNA-specific adenosine deaminase 2-like isoform X4 n=1 Tax=Cylas formicarius TaxID=197179 RepID=UPI0029585A23|nr:tRNA-specific adenosine deaminase 2-like isoform X4 [Cylas formicarius]